MGGMYSDDMIRRVKDANDLLDVVRSYGVELKRAGRNFKALSPFQKEKTPSFNVNVEGQYYKCFSSGKGGDVFSFVMEQERVEFPEAMRILADRVGIVLETDPEAARQHKKTTDWKSHLYRLNGAANRFYSEQLHAGAGETAREYLVGRGIEEAMWKTFALGYAPGGSALAQRLIEQKAPARALARAGLTGERDDGSPYDYFRNRLMFPIHDVQGRIIGFGGRVLDDGQPKYLNTRDTPLFNKSKTIYGIYQARDAIVDSRTAVLVEGYTDVIMCHQFGIKNVVAALGTAITPDHIRLLRRLADELILLTDSDAAGGRAAERSVEILFQEDMPAKVVRLPGEAKDPCEFLLAHGREAFEAALAEGVSTFEYKFQCVANAHDLATSAGQVRAAKELMALVSLAPDPLRRAAYRRDIAGRLNLPEKDLAFDAPRRTPDRDPDHDEPFDPARARPVDLKPPTTLAKAERDLLRFLFHQPAFLESALGEVDMVHFAGEPERLIARALWAGVEAGHLPPTIEQLAREDVSSADFMAREVLDRLTGTGEALTGYEPVSDRDKDAARQVAIALAEEGNTFHRLKADEAYLICVHAVHRAKLEHELDIAKRAVMAARAKGDKATEEAAEARKWELYTALKQYKRSV